ncbi:hypothetical protein [Streptomyces sp. G-G2]|uniref:hypothetical protein n=1 Tax=Streptomyces sp. G-G2 TaxID=3046201 RepID=UPI0024B8F696|nr:hypothetical protein [Streptomyces sp. G-G2]MDJ0384783.1 hypothetical protein [Streptomyces sp. G-G2]
MTDSTMNSTSNSAARSTEFRVTVEGERFTCEDVQGLGPQGDGGFPGEVLTVTLTGCVLTDTPKALSWALAEDPRGPRSVSIEETDAVRREVITTWELTDAAPNQVRGASTTASNHETRIQRITLNAAKITPVTHPAATEGPRH